MLDIVTLREVLRILTVLVEKALKDGHERLALTSAILFSYMSSRLIAKCANCSHQAVGRITIKFLALPLPVPDFDSLESEALRILLYPHIKARASKKRRPPYELIEKEQLITPKKYRKKLNLIYEEYVAQDPNTALSRSHYYFLVRRHLRLSKHEHIFEYEPGEVLFCDYAGMKAAYFDKATCKKVQVYVFVAVLGYSKKMFAYATPNITAKDWIRALVEAIHFFGGTPHLIHFDNGQLVQKAGKLAKLNEHVDRFRRYYNVACDTSGVGKPTHNANAEKTVQYFENKVLVAMRDLQFFGIKQMNTFFDTKSGELNSAPMQKKGVSRDSLFSSKEAPALEPLTKEKYRPFDRQFKRKSAANCTVLFDDHQYSVPYKDRNKELTIELEGEELRVFKGIDEIAHHKLSREKGGRTILPEHKHPEAIAEDNKNLTEFVKWAQEIGPNAVAVVEKQYEGLGSPRSRRAGKCCLVLKGLAKDYSCEEFESACQYALRQAANHPDSQSMTSPEEIQLILQSGIHVVDEESLDLLPVIGNHKNVRGVEFYRGLR